MNEFVRQLSHLLFGLLIAIFIYLGSTPVVIAVLSSSIFAGFLFSDAISKGMYIPLISPIVGHLERDVEYPGKGTLVFLITALFLTAIFPGLIAALSILVLAVLDSISTIVGITFGLHKIYLNKSAEGTLAGIGATFLVLLLFIHPMVAFITACIAGITELYSPVDDNMTIPLITALTIVSLSLFSVIL